MKQSGNALFLILIAVALFAALSYAITQSSRSGGSGISKETDMITAAQFVQSLSSLKPALMRMIATGTPIQDIKLSPPGSPWEPCTDTDGTCLFTPQGGGVAWPTVPSGIVNQELLDAMSPPEELHLGQIKALGYSAGCSDPSEGCGAVQGVGTSLPEVGVGLPVIKENICRAINKGLGIDTIPVQDPTEFFANIADNHVTFTAVPGAESFCIDISEAATGTPNIGFLLYLQVLYPR